MVAEGIVPVGCLSPRKKTTGDRSCSDNTEAPEPTASFDQSVSTSSGAWDNEITMSADLTEHIASIAARFDVEVIYVFGSRQKEITALVHGGPQQDPLPYSDVDVGVQPTLGRHLSARERVHLACAFEDAFGVERVDVVILPEAHALLAAEVVRGELLYCLAPDLEAEVQLYYLRKAGDLAPFFKNQWRQLVGSEL